MVSREQFTSRTGFILAAAGSAIGLGNIWGFPTQTASNGGGAFVLIYLVLAFVLAYPALMAELIIGRHSRANVVTALRAISIGPMTLRLGSVVGFAGVITASLILSFYAIVAGWMLSYLLKSITDMLGASAASEWLVGSGAVRNISMLLIFMLLTMAIVARGVTAGIERWSQRLMPALMVLLVALIVYVLFQPGADQGLRVYLLPDFSSINSDLIIRALGQAFFSLSLGVGTMLIYGSYINEREHLPKLGVMVTVFDTGIAFVAGLLIIPAMYVAQHYGASIFDENGGLLAGPNLIFQVLPTLFDSMGAIGQLVALAFFLLMVIASLTSSISMLEVPVSLVDETTNANRVQATWLACGLITLISVVIVFNFGVLFDWVISATTVYSQPLLGMMLCVFVGWIWCRDNLLQELKKGFDGAEYSLFWRVWPLYVRFLCPLLILAAFVQSVWM